MDHSEADWSINEGSWMTSSYSSTAIVLWVWVNTKYKTQNFWNDLQPSILVISTLQRTYRRSTVNCSFTEVSVFLTAVPSNSNGNDVASDVIKGFCYEMGHYSMKAKIDIPSKGYAWRSERAHPEEVFTGQYNRSRKSGRQLHLALSVLKDFSLCIIKY